MARPCTLAMPKRKQIDAQCLTYVWRLPLADRKSLGLDGRALSLVMPEDEEGEFRVVSSLVPRRSKTLKACQSFLAKSRTSLPSQ